MDESLNVHIPVAGFRPVLRARAIRNDTLRTLAEAWGENPDRVGDLLDQLAAFAEQGGGGWDDAVLNLESDLQMDDAEVELDGEQAQELAADLTACMARTIAGKAALGTYLTFPHQQDRRHDAA